MLSNWLNKILDPALISTKNSLKSIITALTEDEKRMILKLRKKMQSHQESAPAEVLDNILNILDQDSKEISFKRKKKKLNATCFKIFAFISFTPIIAITF